MRFPTPTAPAPPATWPALLPALGQNCDSKAAVRGDSCELLLPMVERTSDKESFDVQNSLLSTSATSYLLCSRLRRAKEAGLITSNVLDGKESYLQVIGPEKLSLHINSACCKYVVKNSRWTNEEATKRRMSLSVDVGEPHLVIVVLLQFCGYHLPGSACSQNSWVSLI
jgi:hypothetical protein